MDTPNTTENPGFIAGNPLKLDPEFRHGPDATGYWFAAAVLFAVLAAGVILYRSADSDFATVSTNSNSITAQAILAAPAPTLRQ